MQVLENATACLHNIAMVERNFHILREHDFVEILQPYLESSDSETQLIALATLGKNVLPFSVRVLSGTKKPIFCLFTVQQGPVVQSVISLTSSLRVISLTVLEY